MTQQNTAARDHTAQQRSQNHDQRFARAVFFTGSEGDS